MTTNEFDRFLKSILKPRAEVSVYQLAGDASTRKYFRVLEKTSTDANSYVLMQWEPFDEKNYPFLSVLRHFAKNKIKVPSVVSFASAEGLVLLEDLGDLTLERKFWENQNSEPSFRFYQAAIDEALKIHFVATRDNQPECSAHRIKFDTEKFLWEMNYGKDNLIKGICQFRFSEGAEQKLAENFTSICSRLDKEPKYISHRDYHSRNLMIKYDEMRVIDFQDARLGPIQYDLVSLLRDSYVNMSEELALKLLFYYVERAKDLKVEIDIDHFMEIYELQTIQRCFKACGSFASFYMQRNDTRYLKYISNTLKRVLKALNHFPEYKHMADILIDSGALERKYEALT